MKKYLPFVFVFLLIGGITIFSLTRKGAPKENVLAEETQIPQTPIPSDTPQASPTESPTASASSTPKPSIKPTVTPEATASAVPTKSPTPTPIPQPTFSSQEIYELTNKYAGQYGVSADVLRYIARCESGLNPFSRSSNGLYAGLFQFSASAWANYRGRMGEDVNPDLRVNAEEAIQTASYVISIGKSGIWPNCTP